MPGQVYNIAGGNERENIVLTHKLLALLDRDENYIQLVKDRPGHDWRYAIDASKIRQDLGFEPAYDFEQGLVLTYRWMLDNESWWRAVMDGSYREWVDVQYQEVDL